MSALDRLVSRPLPRPFPHVTGVRPVILGAFLAVAAVGLLQVAQTSSATTTGYNLQRLEQTRATKQAQVHQLEAEVAQLTSMDRIEKEAAGRLGMVPAENVISLEVHKQPPAQQLVPRRFLQNDGATATSAQPWWRKVLGVLPFF
jgi:cell division protein FtsL